MKRLLLLILLSFSFLISSQDNLIGSDIYGTDIYLTPDERAYLDNLKEIKLCIDPNWMPYEAIESDKHIGIISDYFKLFSRRLNIPITLIPTKNYPESRKLLEDGTCHIISADVATLDVLKKFDATDPYITSPRVFAMHKDHPRVDSFEDLLNRRIGVQKESPALFLLKQKYPDINLTSFVDTDSGLRSLEAKEIDAFVNIIGSISHSIQKQSLTSVKIGGEVLNEISLSILVNKEYSQLVPIFNKVIKTISNRDIINISEKWIIIRHEGFIDYTLIYRLIALFSVLLLFLLYHIYSKNRLNKVLQEKNRELKDISRTDPLTGIMNRRALTAIITSDIHRNLRSGLTSCLLLLDIDHFKRVNDTYGHDFGDVVLKRVSSSIKDRIRSIDFFARWGGEEFLILASGTSLYNANVLAEKIRKTVEDIKYDKKLKTTISIGVAEFTNNETIDDWVKRVDNALYKAKESGRNRVVMDNLLNEGTTSPKNPFSQVIWRPEFSSNNLKIDNEHRELFTQINNLANKVLNYDDNKREIVKQLQSILSETENHFTSEESLFQNTSYPDKDKHIKAHSELILKSNEVIKLYEMGSVSKTEILSFFIFDLIVKHVLEMDTGYFPYIKKYQNR